MVTIASGHSHRGGLLNHQTQEVVAQTTKAYEAHTPPNVQDELDMAEVDARILHHFIDNETMDVEIGSWIPDPGSYRAHATLYTKTVDLYWLLKTLMGKVLVERNEAHEEIFLQLDEMQLQLQHMDKKLDRMANPMPTLLDQARSTPKQWSLLQRFPLVCPF
jgi:hypothetical protein